jgi:hypothetical protein
LKPFGQLEPNLIIDSEGVTGYEDKEQDCCPPQNWNEVNSQWQQNCYFPSFPVIQLFIIPKNVPDEIMANISDQIQQIQIVPKRLEDFSQVERDNFPSIFDWYV